jgi:hypothetical protein
MIARCLTFYLLTIGALALSMPLWRPYLYNEKPRTFTAGDEMRFIVENGQYGEVDAGITAYSEAQQEEFEEVRHDIGAPVQRDIGAFLNFSASTRDKRKGAPSDVYVVFDGAGALALEPYCAPGGRGEKESSRLETLPAKFDGLLDVRSDRKILRLPSSSDDFEDFANLTCDLPDSLLWTRSRQKNYFTLPRISIMTWEIKKRPPGWNTPQDMTKVISAKTCTRAGYTPDPFEKLETVDSRMTSESAGYNGEREWHTCKGEAGFFGGGGDDGITAWTAFTPVGLFGFVAIGEGAESEHERNLFLAGIFLGVAAALAVESIAVTLELAENRAVFLASRRTRSEPTSQPTASSSQVRSSEGIQAGERWHAWKKSNKK